MKFEDFEKQLGQTVEVPRFPSQPRLMNRPIPVGSIPSQNRIFLMDPVTGDVSCRPFSPDGHLGAVED